MKNALFKKRWIILGMALSGSPLVALDNEPANWPSFVGPNEDFSYQMPEGVTPATAASHMRHIWDSEDFVGATGLSRQQMPSGGAATPIIYNGRIYLWYFTPNLDEGLFDPNPSTRKVPEEFGGYGSLFRVIDNAVSSDQNILCMDLDSGKTLWHRKFPATGLVQNGHKDGLNNMTMAAGDGKVYAFGSGRHIYCLDAETGALHWRSDYPNHTEFQRTRAEQMHKTQQFKRSRDGNHYLLLVDGVVVTGGNDNGTSLAGFDAATGQQLWKNSGWIGGRSMPKIWRHQGKGYLVAGGFGKLGLIDPADGSLLWQLTEGMANPSSGLSVQGDLLFTNRGNPDSNEVTNGNLACYQLSTTSPTLLWEAPEADGFPTAKNQGIFVHDGTAFMRSLNQVHLYDVQTGAKQGAIDLGDDGNDDTAIVFRINNYLYQVIDSQHLHYPTVVVDMDTRQIVGSFTILHPGISYSSQMLPVFHGDRMILRRGYCRVSAFTFKTPDSETLRVKVNEPISVVASEETATFTASVVEGTATEVQWFVDGSPVKTDTSEPYSLEVTKSEAGVYQVHAVAIADGGEQASSFKKLLKVVDWEVLLLPRKATIQVGTGKRRFIPIAVDANTGALLPQKFQAVRQSQSLDNTWLTPFQSPSSALEASWHVRANLTASAGTIHTSAENLPGADTPLWSSWGTYTSDEAGTHTVTGEITHNGVTRSAKSTVHVFAADEKLSQELVYLPTPRNGVVGGSSASVSLALSSGDTQWGIEVIDGPASIRGIGRFNVLGQGVVTLEIQHSGNDRYLPLDPIRFKIPFVPAGDRTPQTISFPAIMDRAAVSDPFVVTATSPSELPVEVSVISGPAAIDPETNTVTLTGGTGTVTLIAEHHGDPTYASALPVLREFQVTAPDKSVIAMSITEKGAERGPENIEATLTRSFHTDSMAAVGFTISGEVNEADFTTSGADSFSAGLGTVIFAPGETEKVITLTPIDDSVEEGTERLVFTVSANASYFVRTGQGTGNASILDAQTNYAPEIELLSPSSGSLTLGDQSETGSLQVSASDDQTPSTSLAVSWTTLSGPGDAVFTAPSDLLTDVTFPSYGDYVLQLEVTDGEGLSSSRSVDVAVLDGLNNSPTASFTTSGSEGEAPYPVDFNASNSSDPDGDPLTYHWDFGDGSTGAGIAPSHTYSSTGTYTVTLTVDDSRTGTDQSSRLIVVTPPVASGTVVWLENFEGLANGTRIDDGATAWSLSSSSSGPSVQSGELFGSNLDATFTWTSQEIDISGGLANFSMALKSPPTDELEPPDFLRVSYEIDGGERVQVAEFVDKTTPIGDVWSTLTQNDLSGSSLVIIIEMHNTSGAERYHVDNVAVRVEPSTSGYSSSTFDGWVLNVSPDLIVNDSLKGFFDKANGLLENGLIYAFGINSLDPADAAGKLPRPQLAQVGLDHHLEVTFRRKKEGMGDIVAESGYTAAGVNYVVECSRSMGSNDWHSNSDGITIMEIVDTVDNGDGTDTVTARVTQPIRSSPGGKEFIRVRIEPLQP